MDTTASYNIPACLIILDGFGLGNAGKGNAISEAKTPALDNIFSTCPHIALSASGSAVGLPKGQMGNSEVGHLNIGAGRIVYQELTRINKACEEDTLKNNPVLLEAFDEAKKQGSVLHLMGLLSDGGVHSSNKHLYALLRLAKSEGVQDIALHCFMDGRDVAPKSGAAYLTELEKVIADLQGPDFHIEIASIAGRYFAMDRDNRWERVEKAYRALVNAAPVDLRTPLAYMHDSYAQEITDEFTHPVSFSPRGILGGDVVIFFNFRPDRAREISHALCDTDFTHFARGARPEISFVSLTTYDTSLEARVVFEKEFTSDVLADCLARAHLTQYHIAETEKYAHVTFFLNGGKEAPKENEIRVLIPSPQVPTYDVFPQMSAPEVAQTLGQAIEKGEADVYIVNFANCDMVGHTGVLSAAIEAVEAVDAAVAQVLAALKKRKGTALLCADHGNAEKMIDGDGTPFTAHTTAPVPLALIDYSGRNLGLVQSTTCQGALSNIAPTLLEIIGLDIPAKMTAQSLLTV
jgi:2,3-bisphosphoglycerate-independent phosphoglycerate mutase